MPGVTRSSGAVSVSSSLGALGSARAGELDGSVGFPVSRLSGRLIATLLRLGVPRSAWDDVLQDCLVAWFAAQRPIWNPEGWFLVVFRRQAVVHSLREGACFVVLDDEWGEIDTGVTLGAAGARLDLASGLRRLSRSARRALILRYVEGCSVPEIATALGVSTANAKKLLVRGLSKLRSHFQSTPGGSPPPPDTPTCRHPPPRAARWSEESCRFERRAGGMSWRGVGRVARRVLRDGPGSLVRRPLAG